MGLLLSSDDHESPLLIEECLCALSTWHVMIIMMSRICTVTFGESCGMPRVVVLVTRLLHVLLHDSLTMHICSKE